MFISVHTVLVFVFCTVVAVKLLSTLLWPGQKKFVKRDFYVHNVLDNVQYVINRIGEDSISVEDIVLSIELDTLGQFWATSGWVRNMTSLKKTDGDIILQLSEMTENVEFNVYLEKLKVTFNHFRVNISNTEYLGSINVDIKKNLFRIKLVIDFLNTGNCTATLHQLTVEEFNDITVNVTGTESNKDLTSTIINIVSNNVRILVRHRIEEYFRKVFRYVLSREDFCINKPTDDDDY